MVKHYHTWSETGKIKAGRRFMLLGAVMLAVGLAGGCFEKYGQFKPSGEMRRLFESHQVLPDHKYYYTGNEDGPDAIIGIHKDYILDDSVWYSVDLTSARLAGWIETLSRDRDSGVAGIGALILDPASKRIGIWYSPWDFTAVKMLGDNRVSVHPPLAVPEFDDDKNEWPGFGRHGFSPHFRGAGRRRH